MQTKPLILFDTDMDTDVDDAGALAILLSYAKQGKADLLGIIADGPDRYAAAACEALCRHYGVTCPIGTIHDHDYPSEETDRFVKYRAQHRYLTPERCYTHALAARIGKIDTDYQDACTTYRSLLAGAPDHSVTIVCVGLLTALDELLRSTGDEISPLSGIELVAKKVLCVVSMTNAVWPEVVAKNFNYDMDPLGSEAVVAACPVPIHASPDGAHVITGQTLTDRLPLGHPLRVSYEMYNEGERRGRSSWDLVALYYALEPTCGLFAVNDRGRLCYEAKDLHTYWQQNGDREDREVRLAIPNEEMAARLEELLVAAG
ncbi:MAG: nucleoside hydrolase [Clostridia bacterium]|nr:nucleoside hydrolase [Clostridia bacterium]